MHAHGLLACLPSLQRTFLTCLASVVLISFDAECDVEGIIRANYRPLIILLIVGRGSNQIAEGGSHGFNIGGTFH